MKKKQLVDKMTQEFDLKPGKARAVVDLVLKELIAASSSDEGFSSPILNIKVSDRTQKSADPSEQSKEASTHRIATMHAAKAYETATQS